MPPDRSPHVTGTMLRDIVVCERRAWHDLHTEDGLRDLVAPFVELLWAQGISHEREILGGLEGTVDLRAEEPGNRRRLTGRALSDPAALHVLGGEIVHGDLVGRPDVISRIEGIWVGGDVKAGTPFMPDGRRVKLEYGVQIGLYALILGNTGLGAGDRAFVIGADGRRSVFDLDAPWGRATLRGVVADTVDRARRIHDGVAVTRGAASAQCGLCHWRSLCRGELEAADDLTLVAELGRKLRRDVERIAPDRTKLANLDLDDTVLPGGKTVVPGLGAERLRRFQDRARLQKTPGAGAYSRVPLGLARSPIEWHLDIEADPTRDGLVYLHGIWERVIHADGSRSSRFVHFFADGPDGERDAFGRVWAFLRSSPDARIYYYSRFERTSYRALQRRHPDVCTVEAVEAFFADPRVIDLYTDVVKPKTEWPLASYGIKPIAKSLGFFWAAEDASGASSIAWYDEYARTGDPSLREKIIDYNRSDCIASAVVLDALIALPVGAPPWAPAAGVPEGSRSETYCVADGDVEEASEEGRPVGSSERSSRPPSEGTGPQLIDEPPVSGHGAGTPSRCRTGTPALVRAVYAAPSLTPCLDPIAPEVDDGVRVGLRATYAALEGELPLAGGDAMRPTPGGGLLLCERLREALPWMEDAISVVERQLKVALWAGRPWLQWRPLCLVGPAGVGKSHLARELGRIAGVGAAQLDLGGTHDSGALAATARGWTNTRPCWPAEMMNAFLCANPVLTLDEIDKAGGSKRNGDPQNAVLAMLEPGTAAVYFDTSLMARVDLSAVCWLATANDADLLPAPLRSRLDIVRVVPPAVEHVDGIVQGILHSMAKRWAMPAASLPEIPPRAMAVLRDDFARHRSVRRLKRHVQDVLAALISLPRGNLH